MIYIADKWSDFSFLKKKEENGQKREKGKL